MSAVVARPAVLHGHVRAPPSKSYTHRALLAAHLAARPSTIVRPLVADDTLRTARALGRLGSRVRIGARVWTVRPGRATARSRRSIDCGESGTTLRFVAAAAALQSATFLLRGSGRLPSRPMGPILRALRALGATAEPADPPRSLPLLLRGPIHGGVVDIDRSESSQFTSAMLLALPTVRPSSRIRSVGVPVSEPYVRATVAMLRSRGIRLSRHAHGFAVPGGQHYRGGRLVVPGDASSAAYLWAGAAVSGGSVRVDDVPKDWPQADAAVLDLLARFGATVRRSGSAVRVDGGERRPFRFDFDDCPDLFPLAGVLAATADGRSVLDGGSHAAVKESDRRAETTRVVRALGARAQLSRSRLVIHGVRAPRPIVRLGSRDHRVVMSAMVGALTAGAPSRIGEREAVGKSFPEFFDVWRSLGGRWSSA